MESKQAEAPAGLVDQVFTFEGRFNTKEDRLAGVDAGQLDECYVSNSRKEELCLKYVDNFVRQFEALFPDRSKLFLTPKNECGIPKFVCTTIRPTQLPFKSLYNVRAAAEFFSHFITYEPLSNPLEPPPVLPSPTFTLQHQTGDCFDLATLLCSYLVGSGYEAYCVYGYAPMSVTLLNRTRETCPLLEKEGLVDIRDEDDGENIVLFDLRKQDIASEEGGIGFENGEYDFDGQGDGSHESKSGGDHGDSGLGEENGESKLGDAEPSEQKEEKDDNGAANNSDAINPNDEDQPASSGENPQEQENSLGEGDPGVSLGGSKPSEENVDEDPYAASYAGVKESEYILRMKARSEAEANKSNEEDEASEPEEEAPDHLDGKRVHCWVLVRAGKRAVEQSFFVEPSTGKLYTLLGSPYQGVEAVWNHKNYWVNMQQEPEDPMNISFNLNMQEYWEYIFVDPLGAPESKSQEAANDGEPGLEAEVGANAGVEMGNSPLQEAKSDSDMILDLPPSWVRKLILSRDSFRRRYNDSGQRTQLFAKCKLESYAEHLHPHGLVRRLVTYEDRARTLPVEVREYFMNRRDKLTLRVRHPLKGRVEEYFAEGRASGLMTIDEVSGKTRDVIFYPGARLDGLVNRYEEIGEKIVEKYENREDHLERRIVNLSLASQEEGVDAARVSKSEEKKSDLGHVSKNMMTLPRAHHGGDLAILKMQQIFLRNPKVDADADIAKRSFQISQGKFSVVYHFAKGRITRSTRVFYKDANRLPEIKLSGSFAEPLRPSQVEDEFQQHLQAEKDCYQQVRDAEREMQDILALRKREESNIVLEKNIFDTAREKSKQDTVKQTENQVQEEKDPRHVDYLTPFLQHIPDIKKIKREEALAARDACLRSLKERLLERANIIQCRLDEENAQLAKKQAAFQRSRDHVDGADLEFERYCSESMFRIQILEQRLSRHEESALSLYASLDARLRQDPRIAAALSTRS